MTMIRSSNNDNNVKDIKLEATLFDGYETIMKSADDSFSEDVRLHISLLVDITKSDRGDSLEFVCSSWPDSLEIQKVYLLRRDNVLSGPCMGPVLQ